MNILFLFLFLCICIVFPSEISAAKSVTFTINVSSLKSDEEMVVTASPSGFQEGENIYIKGAFYKDGSSNYFGFTKNGDSWVKNSASTVNQRKVTIGEWDRMLFVKSDPSDSGFQDSGTYKFKVGFYTISADGDPSSVRWSDTIVDVYLEKPFPTNTPQPTATRTPTPQPTAISSPTQKLTPSSTPSSSPIAVTPTPQPSPTIIKQTPTTSDEPSDEDTHYILGTQDGLTPTPEKSPEFLGEQQSYRLSQARYRNAAISLFFIGTGFGLLSLVLYGKRLFQRFKSP